MIILLLLANLLFSEYEVSTCYITRHSRDVLSWRIFVSTIVLGRCPLNAVFHHLSHGWGDVALFPNGIVSMGMLGWHGFSLRSSKRSFFYVLHGSTLANRVIDDTTLSGRDYWSRSVVDDQERIRQHRQR